ncbi:hypothetical protein MalM25_32380 [Planctomycetes bacterium MalM25]|nr:hypothetical protein MalM25_32380 [Planctomycetes bacterium MalM25]
MFPPAAGPPPAPAPAQPVGDWARLEAKGPTTEADLLRQVEQVPLGVNWSFGPIAESFVAWLLTLFDA